MTLSCYIYYNDILNYLIQTLPISFSANNYVCLSYVFGKDYFLKIRSTGLIAYSIDRFFLLIVLMKIPTDMEIKSLPSKKHI